MKYGIEARLPAAAVDLVQRFHSAMLLRIHQVQQGAAPAIGNPIDAAIAAMHRWGSQQQSSAGGCPPCNHACNEGRDCPARKPATLLPIANEARDAARYRWLRQQHWNTAPLCVVAQPRQAVKLGHDCPTLDRLDVAVDQAMDAAGVPEVPRG